MLAEERTRRLILVVEDEPGRHSRLTPPLERAGYDVRAVGHGNAAISAVVVRHPEAVLVGVGPAAGDARDVCRRIRADPANEAVPVIVLTDPHDRDGFDEAAWGIDAGADDILELPFADDHLLATIEDALEMRRAIADLAAVDAATAASLGDADLHDTPEAWAGMAGLAHRLATRAGLDASDTKGVVFGALMHDIGNVGVGDTILQKPGPLTHDEAAAMRRHPVIGENICRSFPSSRDFASIVRHHHERWDGFGYPDRLRGDAIPVGARIVGLVDAFDAMLHDRPYRAALELESALLEIIGESGRQFDPDLVPLFVEVVDPAVRARLRVRRA
ncbi:MAG: HD domain-containing phosphohydrolase [Chloroflexota bacterium]